MRQFLRGLRYVAWLRAKNMEYRIQGWVRYVMLAGGSEEMERARRAVRIWKADRGGCPAEARCFDSAEQEQVIEMEKRG